jgi:hypothetical protein
MTYAARAAIAALLLLSTSCGLAGKEFTVKRVLNVHASGTDPACQETTATFNLSEDKAFNDLKANIGSITLKKVRVIITNPKTDAASVATKVSGQLSVAVSQTDTKVTLGSFEGLALTSDNAQEVSFDADSAKAVIAAALNPPNTFFVGAKGCADAVPASFDLAVEVTVFATLKI